MNTGYRGFSMYGSGDTIDDLQVIDRSIIFNTEAEAWEWAEGQKAFYTTDFLVVAYVNGNNVGETKVKQRQGNEWVDYPVSSV